jgi:hypothetical protein
MAKRPDLSSSQRKIVDRYYEHRGTIHATKLAELVSEIAVETEPKKLDRLWKSASDYLVKCGVDAKVVGTTISTRDLRLLGEITGAIMVGKAPPRVLPPRPQDKR